MADETEPRPRPRRWLRILVGALAALVLVFAVLIVGGVWVAKQQVEAVQARREVAEAVETHGPAAVGGALAPGVEELRDLGCDRPLVSTVGAMLAHLAREKPDTTASAEAVTRSPETMVTCLVGSTPGLEPGCDAVAARYGAAREDGPDRFIVVVAGPGEARSRCSGWYDRQGKRLGGLDPDTFALVPAG